MASWDVHATRASVERLFGRQQRTLAEACLRSLVDRREYAHVHYHEANGLFTQFAKEYLEESSLLEVVWSEDDDVRLAFQHLVTKIGANVIACIQSLHSLADIWAHAIYFSLGENLEASPLAEDKITAKSVVRRIAERQGLADVHALFTAVIKSGQFDHLEALANHSKHRSIIRTSFSEDMTGQAPERYTLKLPSFQFKGNPYPEVDAREFIQDEFDRLSELLVDLGNALNAALLGKEGERRQRDPQAK